MAFDKKVYATSKKYTDDSIEGTAGVIAGKNCTIDSITDITGGHRVTFKWTADNGDVRTATMDVMDGDKGDTGLGIKAVAINSSNHLIVTFDDDTTDDAGELTDLNTSFAHITDIDLNNLQNGQTLQYNATSQTWQNVNPGSVSTDLGDLNDVDLNNLTDGQIIVWDATDSKWKNATNDVTALAGRVTAIESVIPSTATTSNKVATASDLADKVDKVSGKALSTNDYDNTAKGKLDALSNIQQIGAGLALDNETHELSATGISITIDNEMSASSTNPVQNKVITAALGNKVDTVSGKGLSTNDYTNADKDIVDGVTTALSGKADASTVSAILDGQSIDSFADVETALGGKADKVVSAVNGNFAGLDANGNLTDSGSKASDFVAASAGEAGDTVVTFTDPQADGTITSGSALKTIIGLIKYKLAHIVSGHTIVNSSGTSQTARKKLKFTGSATVTDDSENDQTIVNITGGGSGGHTIENSSGTAMPQRADLQFVGATVTDDSTNNRTVVTATAASVGAVAASNLKNAYQSSPTAGTEVYDAAYINGLAGVESVKVIVSNSSTSGQVQTAWSSSPVSIAGDSSNTYYKKTITLSHAIYGIPEVKPKASGNNKVMTDTEKGNYDCLDWYGLDPDYPTQLNLYAKTKPTGEFYIWVIRDGGRV